MKQLCSFNNGYFIRSINLFQQLRFFYSTSTSTSMPTSASSSPSIKDEDGLHHNCSISELLVQSLGFSKRQSLSTFAKYVKHRRIVDSSEANSSKFVGNAHSVIQFFQQLGFRNSDIKKMVSVYPEFIACQVERTLKPKIELLMESGFSKTDIVVAISKNPFLLFDDLGRVIHAFRTVLGSDKNVIAALKQSIHYISISKSISDNIVANVELLQCCYGIPTDIIQKFVIMNHGLYTSRTDILRDLLVRVEHNLGIPRDSPMFMYGINLLFRCSEKKLESKFAVFESFGWTQSDVMALIRHNPLCWTSSEARIKERLDFLMNQLNYKPYYLASQSPLFTYSLEKRLLPRYRVSQVLKEKGLCRKDYRLISLVVLPEPVFLKRFVLPFEVVHQLYSQLTGRKVGSHTTDT